MEEQLGFFEFERQPSPSRPLSFSPFKTARSRRKVRPRFFSRIPQNTNIASAFRGGEMQKLPVLRQGEEVAALLEASTKEGLPLYRTVVIMMPRRASKTTSVWNVILGRCDSMEGYRVVTTAQDGTRARNRFREVQRALEATDFEGRRSARNRRGKLRWANGDESIEFDNGSRIWVVPPDPSALRGEAADLMLFDEAGELAAEKTADLVAGALPLMDTRPRGQVIVTGTPALERAGLLWDTLERGRAARPSVGILEYSVSDDDQTFLVDDEGNPRLNRDLLRRTHPGIGTLTTLEIIAERAESMPRDQFEREYLCRFPFDSSTAALSAKAWAECALPFEELPARPDRVGLAYDVAPDSSFASLVAAWRDEDGRACFELLAYDPGTLWLPPAGQKAARKHRARLAYDLIGANQEPADRLHRMRVGLEPLNLKGMQGAAARLASEITRGNVRHWSQPDLTRAVEGAAWRNVGEGGRLFGRKASAHDVSPLVAASEALWVYDQAPDRAGVGIIRAGGGGK